MENVVKIRQATLPETHSERQRSENALATILSDEPID
jgi:hypothetical protein